MSNGAGEAVAGAGPAPPRDEAEIEHWILARVRELLEEDAEAVSAHKPLAAFGLDSVDAAELVEALEEWLGVALPSSLVWEWGSSRELALRIAEHLREGSAEASAEGSADGRA